MPFILEHRERFVLKANDEYGGKGIILGWETDAERWVQAMQTALDEPFVVQERVAVPKEGYPTLQRWPGADQRPHHGYGPVRLVRRLYRWLPDTPFD